VVIFKLIYGLHCSCARWYDKFAECVSELGFFPCIVEPDVWLWHSDNRYEYVAVYVDDLEIAIKIPKAYIDILENVSKFKSKETGPITFHFKKHCSRTKDDSKKPMINIVRKKSDDELRGLFGQKLKNVSSPLKRRNC
jgi:hypothetical protein